MNGQSVAIVDGNAYLIDLKGSLAFVKELYIPGETGVGVDRPTCRSDAVIPLSCHRPEGNPDLASLFG